MPGVSLLAGARHPLRYLLLVVITACLLGGGPARANGSGELEAPRLQLDDSRLGWTALSLKGGKLLVSVSADVSMHRVTDNLLSGVLLPPQRGQAISPAGQPVLFIDFHSLAMGKDLHTRLWFRARDVAALQRSRVEATRGDERYKLYRFTREGIFIVRRKPMTAEAQQPPEQWHDVKHSFVPYPPGIPDGMVVSDPAVLLYLASVADFKQPGDELRLLAYFDDKLQIITMHYEGEEEVAADFKARGPGGSQHIKGSRQALRLGLASRPLDMRQGNASLRIAGLGGKLKILVDRKLRVPLELRGKAKVLGKVSLRLHKVRLSGEN